MKFTARIASRREPYWWFTDRDNFKEITLFGLAIVHYPDGHLIAIKAVFLMFHFAVSWHKPKPQMPLRIAVLKAIKLNGADACISSTHKTVNEILGRKKWWNGVGVVAFAYCLCELEDSQLISDYLMSRSSARGCREKRYFYLTRLGEVELEQSGF